MASSLKSWRPSWAVRSSVLLGSSPIHGAQWSRSGGCPNLPLLGNGDSWTFADWVFPFYFGVLPFYFRVCVDSFPSMTSKGRLIKDISWLSIPRAQHGAGQGAQHWFFVGSQTQLLKNMVRTSVIHRIARFASIYMTKSHLSKSPAYNDAADPAGSPFLRWVFSFPRVGRCCNLTSSNTSPQIRGRKSVKCEFWLLILCLSFMIDMLCFEEH